MKREVKIMNYSAFKRIIKDLASLGFKPENIAFMRPKNGIIYVGLGDSIVKYSKSGSRL
jgi:hypothetical protein